MKLSSQEEYGLRCLLRLARRPEASLTIPEISQAEGLSTSNAAKILRILRRGGYSLARPPADIVVGEVLSVLGGRLYDPGFCDHFAGDGEVCQHSSIDCSVRSLWMSLQQAVDGVLSRTTLADLLHSGQQMARQHSPLLEVTAP